MKVTCSNQRVSAPAASTRAPVAGRREALLGMTAALVLANTKPSLAANTLVSNTLPASPLGGNFFFYQPNKDATPQLRAGIMTQPPYSFSLEGDFAPERIPNPETGGFCTPKCGEPWKEAVFVSEKLGKIELLGLPLEKLTFKKGVTIESLGKPESLLNGIGPYLTGSSYDPDEVEVIDASARKGKDGLTYFDYYINSEYVVKGQGSRILATVTVKGDVVVLLKISATDKQFKTSEPSLRKTLESFVA